MNDAERDARLAATLPGRLHHLAQRRPQGVALRHKRLGLWEEVTWSGYAHHVACAARAFHELGVGPGDHVAILSDNRPEWLYADLAAQSLGARSVGVYQTSPAADVAFLLQHCAARLLVCENQEQVDKLMQVREALPALEHVLVIEPRGTRDYAEPRLVAWQAELSRGAELLDADWIEARLLQLDPAAPSMVIYTSGTTGRPKGALISSAGVLSFTRDCVEALGLGADEQVLSYLPLCHVAEKFYSSFLPLQTGGITVHFGESIQTVSEDLRQVSPTLFLGVPRIWEKLHSSIAIRMHNSSPLKRALFDHYTALGRRLAARRRAGELGPWERLSLWLGDLLLYRALQERLGLRRCRLPASGAAPIAPELLEWFSGVGVDILEGYGMTECGVTHINTPGRHRFGSVGRAVRGVEQRLAEDGELLIRSQGLFVEYLHDATATREMVDPEGWLHTGDIAELDVDGFLHITGRKKDILITAGGKNLSPAHIENTLKTSPYLKEVVAIGDRRNFVAALVQVELDTVAHWAARQSLSFTSYEDLVQKPAVVALVGEEIRRLNEQLARVEQVRGFRLLPRELQEEGGELTATQKVRRKVVLERHAGLVAEIYGH